MSVVLCCSHILASLDGPRLWATQAAQRSLSLPTRLSRTTLRVLFFFLKLLILQEHWLLVMAVPQFWTSRMRQRMVGYKGHPTQPSSPNFSFKDQPPGHSSSSSNALSLKNIDHRQQYHYPLCDTPEKCRRVHTKSLATIFESLWYPMTENTFHN